MLRLKYLHYQYRRNYHFIRWQILSKKHSFFSVWDFVLQCKAVLFLKLFFLLLFQEHCTSNKYNKTKGLQRRLRLAIMFLHVNISFLFWCRLRKWVVFSSPILLFKLKNQKIKLKLNSSDTHLDIHLSSKHCNVPAKILERLVSIFTKMNLLS